MMHLIFNELSFFPLAESDHDAQTRFNTLLLTLKTVKEKYLLSHIGFPINYQNQEIIAGIDLKSWICNLTNNNLRNLILALIRRPYADDLENDELDSFYGSNYELVDENPPCDNPPVGLVVAHIKSVPAVSFDSHTYWHKYKILVRKTENEVLFATYNICNSADVLSVDFLEWVDNSFINQIENEDMLKLYLNYNKYQITFANEFMEQLFSWKQDDTTIFKRTLLLMKDVQLHPFTGGLGRTENLAYRGKEASKRITGEHRLSYTIENNIVNFIACNGHYDFH